MVTNQVFNEQIVLLLLGLETVTNLNSKIYLR